MTDLPRLKAPADMSGPMSEPRALYRLRAEMVTSLDKAGFRQESERPKWSGKHYFVTWKRPGGWKDDVLVCHWRPRARSVSMEAHWIIPRAGGDSLVVSGINAAYKLRIRASIGCLSGSPCSEPPSRRGGGPRYFGMWRQPSAGSMSDSPNQVLSRI